MRGDRLFNIASLDYEEYQLCLNKTSLPESFDGPSHVVIHARLIVVPESYPHGDLSPSSLVNEGKSTKAILRK